MDSKYIFDTHYGKSTLTDTETGISITWENGKFNESQETTHDAATLATLVPEGRTPEAFYAEKMLEMGEYLLANYPELI